ncbi:MAG: glycosyltransferase family 2 protein [Propionicimonas sp.]|uniref:glycosyltransferase family 2 protein n=1 Tax=Propionicimonas sp. TaxID=1955623 RepID=UPI002B1ECB76|nr:glycosyltransferase family 2 protein [Propionicimonas sp.]MEA4944213.1 glycosyltransferase family 2 protein [Propionicimonas sp.]MEA5052458.1 glycosyltransferase family 2 protein [Propionicimonas sp.]MEA5119098.1 glycosyltransferase family 2 protein [Propionicimonas sp.]
MTQTASRPKLEPLPADVAVSYVMPVLNEAGHLARAVAAVLAQEYPGESELVLALGSSTDGTDAIAAGLAASDSRVRLVRNPANDIPKGLNAAIRATRFPVVVRVDAHAELPPGYTTAMVDLLRRTGAANAGGLMVARGDTPVQAAIARAYNSPFGLGGGVYHHGEDETDADSAYLGVFRREVLFEVGLFDDTLRRGEDWELNARIRDAGYRVVFTPRLEVTYWPRASLAALRRQMYATGVWRGQLVRRHRGTPVRYLPPPLVALIVAGSVLCLLLQALGVIRGGGHQVAAAFHLGAVGYLLGAGTVGVTKLGGDTVCDRLLNAVALITMHLSWGAGFVRGVLFGAERTVDRSRVTA